MALLRLGFCCCVDIGFRSITFAEMLLIHLKFAERYFYRWSLIFVIVRKMLAELWSFFDFFFVVVLILVFTITFAGMHWFYWKFAQGYIIVKYRSSSILVIIHKILAKLWPFFDFGFVIRVKYKVKILFPLNNVWRDGLISFEVCKMVYHYNIEVKHQNGISL